jgi:signal-transduction protein with cAMP-binding, CBS, and nucleotidyltransferase domain
MTHRPVARNIMTAPARTIGERATLEKAAAKMLAEGVSSLVVSPAGEDEPFGIVTTSDIVTALAQGLSAKETHVEAVMSTPLILVTPRVPAIYVARLMDRTGLRHVAVFNGREVLGIISSRDLLKAMMPENPGAAGGRRVWVEAKA